MSSPPAPANNDALISIAAGLFRLHQRKQRYGSTGWSAAEVRKACEEGLNLSCSTGLAASAARPKARLDRPRLQTSPLLLFVQGLAVSLRDGRTGGAAAAAVAHLQAAVKLQPQMLEAWVVLAYCQWERGDLRQALSCLVQGLRLSGATATTWGLAASPDVGVAAEEAAAAGAAAEQAAAATAAGLLSGVLPSSSGRLRETPASAGKDRAGSGSSPLRAAQTTTAPSASPATPPKEPTPAAGLLDPSSSNTVPSPPLLTAPVTPPSGHPGAGSGQPSSSPSAAAAAAADLTTPDQHSRNTPPASPAVKVKEALQLLSMLVHQQQQQQQQQQQPAPATPSSLPGARAADPREPLTAALSLSRDLAAAALAMDLSDPYSWYVLALAELSMYVSRALVGPGAAAARPKALQRLLASFQQAEQLGLADLADLFYNRAALHTYCQSFDLALSDYERAAALDPTLPVSHQIESLVALLTQLTSLVSSKGGIKPKQWAKVKALLAKDAVKARQLLGRGVLHHQQGLSLAGLPSLVPGANKGLALLCRPLVFLSPPFNASATLYIVCVDSEGACLALALVRVSHTAFEMNQLLTVVSPELLPIRLTYKGKDHSFPLVRVDASDSVLLVDGVPVPQE